MNNLRWSNNLYVKETLNFRKEHPHIQYISISFTFHRRSRKHRFHGLLQYLMSAKYAICRSKRGDPSRVKEVQEKTGHKNPHTKRWKPYPLSNLCDLLFLCITAVQLLPTVTTLCVYRLQCWKSRFLLTIFVPGSARVCSNTNLHTSGISGKREWRNLGLKGPWWPLILQDLTQTFPLKQSFMTQSSTPAMRWQNQPTTSKYSSYSFFSVRFHGEFPANRKHIYNHIIYMTMSYVTTICKQRYLFPFWGLLGTKIYQ